MELLVISAMRYSFADDKNKDRTIEGMKLEAIPIGSVPKTEDQRRGLDVMTLSCTDRGLWDQLKDVPGIYSADTLIGQRKGEATVKVSKLTFKSKVELA